MKIKLYLLVFVAGFFLFAACKKESQQSKEKLAKLQNNTHNQKFILPNSEIEIYPIQHSSLVIKQNKLVLYVDPVGRPEFYENIGKPDYILVTDIHADHLDQKVLAKVKSSKTKIIAPQAVAVLLNFAKEDVIVMKNGENKNFDSFYLRAIAMYNTSKDRLKMHEKGRGNGYVINLGGKNIYISGDTEDIPEMRELLNIDLALVCMNLPYTMTVEQAASAVLQFQPKIVMPYHYRGKDGLSDVVKFKNIVAKNKNIQTVQLNWYP